MKKLLHVVGARPNFMKAAPLLSALEKRKIFSQSMVHTGQHYDPCLSDVFFKQLGLPEPIINLGVGSGSHTVQTAQIMIGLEKVIDRHKPDIVIVYGDVNSTVASALVCSKLGIPIAHIEAGLRSFDRTMPEEINRIITDQVSSMLFTHCEDANENLIKEGISKEKIHFVGNLMIDTLIRLLPIAQSRFKKTIQEIGIKYIDSIKYGLVTLHRPSNVDNIDSLLMIFKTLVDLSNEIPLIFPVHPRTAERLTSLPFNFSNSNVHLTTPLGYLEFLALQERAALVITDSGGVQEETTFLHVPCITVRKNTERPITISLGTNVLVGNDMMQLLDTAIEILYNKVCACQIPKYWDGNAGKRAAEVF